MREQCPHCKVLSHTFLFIAHAYDFELSRCDLYDLQDTRWHITRDKFLSADDAHWGTSFSVFWIGAIEFDDTHLLLLYGYTLNPCLLCCCFFCFIRMMSVKFKSTFIIG